MEKLALLSVSENEGWREEGRGGEREREGGMAGGEGRWEGRGAPAKLDSRFLNKTILNRQKKRCKLGAFVKNGFGANKLRWFRWNVAVIRCRRSRGFK